MGNVFSFSPLFSGVVLLTTAIFLFTVWRTFNSRPKPTEFSVKTVQVKGPLRVINFVHDYLKTNFGITLVKRNHVACMKAAKELADSVDTSLFGSQEKFVEAVDRFTRPEFLANMETSASGTILINNFSMVQITMRRLAMEHIQKNREKIEKARLVKPFIIAGLPRTGSTMLHNLLACDPKSRTTFYYEMSPQSRAIPCVKSAEERANDKRAQATFEQFDKIEKSYPGFFTGACQSHRTHPNELEEDILILFHNYLMLLHAPLNDDYLEYFANPNDKEWAYTYHRLYLQMMNEAWTPESHWILKCPGHTFFLDEVQKQFPDAQFVFTHRNPLKVVPSTCRLMEGFLHWIFMDNSLDSSWLGNKISTLLQRMVVSIKDFRSKNDNSVYFDVNYEEFVKDPIEQVKKLYSHFGNEFTPEFEDAMKNWISENRQGKYGRRTYTLEQYGLSEEGIKRDYPDYPDCFSS